MNLTLNKLKNQIFQFKTLLLVGLGIVFLIIITVVVALTRPQKPTEVPGVTPSPSPIGQNIPPPIKQQPVVNGKFDPTAPISQRSKAAIDKLRPYLIYRDILTTSTGNKVTFALFTKPLDQYTLFVEMIGIDFQSTNSDPDLPRNVQDFRETADTIFAFMRKYNVNSGDVFISWGGPAYVQKSAEVWLVESAQFPKVIKKDGVFVFENQPIP